jgi:hypothetical protein
MKAHILINETDVYWSGKLMEWIKGGRDLIRWLDASGDNWLDHVAG